MRLAFRGILLASTLGGIGCGQSTPQAASTPVVATAVTPRVVFEDPTGPRTFNQEDISSEPAVLECKISSDPICEVGEGPVISVAIFNKTGEDIQLIRHLDASDDRWRYPYCYFEITPPDSSKPPGNYRCAFMNPLTEEDFEFVPKDGVFFPFDSSNSLQEPDDRISMQHIHPQFVETPGKYRFRFVYSTAGKTLREYFGNGNGFPDHPKLNPATNPKFDEYFKQVPKTVAKSNEIEVTILPATKKTEALKSKE